MIRRLALTTLIGAATAAALIAGPATGALASSPHLALASMVSPAADPNPGSPPGPNPHDNGHDNGPGRGHDNGHGHGPGWDGRHGNWDGHSGPGHGGGWDGQGGGWDGHHWWVSSERCRAGHGHVIGDRWHPFCRGGVFNGSPIRF
jgi:hypothetical protein